MRSIGTLLLAFVLLFSSCKVLKPGLPSPKTEFRGVWIATVVNIDWPARGTDSWEKQKKDYLNLLKFYKDLNFNTVIVQIRTAGDALYPSDLAPWSRFLTGKEGEAPAADEDPLKWMIARAHEYGFEFHAWLNPYRATFDLKTEVLAQDHDYFLHPDWMIKYGKKYYYNPGLPEVRQKLVEVIAEVTARYDIDAIHFDDYFYPYRIQGENFDDQQSFEAYADPNQDLEDWRRSNVDSLIAQAHRSIKSHKPWVQFGISPFGVWKNNSTDPNGSDTRAGQTTFEDLYADPLVWMEKGWIDYLIPQLYWSMDLEVASHRKLVNWWSAKVKHTNLYIGNGAYKIRNNSDKAWKRKKELPKQLEFARSLPEVQGNAFFSAKSLLSGKEDVVKHIQKRLYQKTALTPASHQKGELLNAQPEFLSQKEASNFYQLSFELHAPDQYQYALVYATRKPEQLDTTDMNQLIAKIHLNGRSVFNLGKKLIAKKGAIAVTFLDRYRTETKSIVLHLNETRI
ncbi:family 10 glycosylhydrolase [Flavobacteriaceae bacterium R33]|uniref:Family 10 glycosylhydrolase n=1 Tax=Poritiphilus flavus TaxID=2697053 RepID=A0A6L9E9G9_9FLAO|nr:family 10 glycosylhydrolase [Poritiphilus flavus]